MKPSNTERARSGASGFSLPELLIGSTISVFLIGGSVSLYTELRQTELYENRTLELRENTRFALNVIGNDLRMANFWGLHRDSSALRSGAAPVVMCRGADIGAWATRLNTPLEANSSVPGCGTTATATLTIRHASEQPQPADRRYLQLRVTHSGGELHQGTLSTAGSAAKNFNLEVHHYYLSNNATGDAPELRRWALGAHHKMYNERIITGITEMQIEWGYVSAAGFNWSDALYAWPSVARVTLTATNRVQGKQITHQESAVFRLHNMPEAETKNAQQ